MFLPEQAIIIVMESNDNHNQKSIPIGLETID